MGDTKVFAVAGRPILHSKSPAIFNAAFGALSMDAVYTRLTATDAGDLIRTAKETALSGINVTAPFKETVTPFLDDISETARIVGAVNTVVAAEGRLFGHNSDVAGVREALSAHGVPLKGVKAVVMGAGGAARAAVYALVSAGAEVVVVNRTLEKAVKLAQEFRCRAAKAEEAGRELRDSAILVSTVPTQDGGALPALPEAGLVVLDANYRTETPLRIEAIRKGCTIIDGREWLLYQGVVAFSLFTGIDAPVEVMREALYDDGCREGRQEPGEGGEGKNIAFVGFMGTGKSTIAAESARRMARPFRDIDQAIEEKAGCSIAEIFRREGEAAFRRMEEEEIEKIGRLHGAVIACGGGAVVSPKNRQVLKEKALVVWLWADTLTAARRLGASGDRPLFMADDTASMNRLLETRIPCYAAASDLIVDTVNKSPGQIVDEVMGEIG